MKKIRNGQHPLTADLGPKTYFFPNFLFRFGFFVSFYLIPELDLEKYALEQKILN
jgi:hypothetical protein